jgi:hypothetical protein
MQQTRQRSAAPPVPSRTQPKPAGPLIGAARQRALETALVVGNAAQADALLAEPLALMHEPHERQPDGKWLTQGARERWPRTVARWVAAVCSSSNAKGRLSTLQLLLRALPRAELPEDAARELEKLLPGAIVDNNAGARPGRVPAKTRADC